MWTHHTRPVPLSARPGSAIEDGADPLEVEALRVPAAEPVAQAVRVVAAIGDAEALLVARQATAVLWWERPSTVHQAATEALGKFHDSLQSHVVQPRVAEVVLVQAPALLAEEACERDGCGVGGLLAPAVIDGDACDVLAVLPAEGEQMGVLPPQACWTAS